MQRTIAFVLNGKTTSIHVDDERMLLWVLRSDLGLTGTKFGCGEGMCGACTVIVEDKAVRSCRTPIGAVDGKRVLTIEGLEHEGQFHPLQLAFVKHNAFQCGYCTPGMIMNAYALLLRKQPPSREQVIQSMDSNLCRCGAQARIVDAIEEVAGAKERA